MLKYITKNYSKLICLNFIWRWYAHVSENTTDIENEKKEVIWDITTSNDYTEKWFTWDFWLYRGLKNYIKDNEEKIWENNINLKEVKKWVKELTNKILDPINSNWIKNLVELERLLVDSYWAWKNHKFINEDWKEINIRFATSFNFSWTTILRTKDRVNAKWWVTDTAIHNLSKWDLISTDSLGWSSIPAAPTGWYFKTQEWEESVKHEGFWFLWKILELRPMSDKFNKELYEKIMNMDIEITFKWFSYESNPDEIVIMPTFTIEWEEIEKEIQKFSEEIPEWKIEVQTSKNYLANL